MSLDVVIIAGGELPDTLKKYTEYKSKAMLKIGDRHMIEYILEAVRGIKGIGRVVCVCREEEMRKVLGNKVDLLLPAKESMMENLRAGIHAVADSERVLICTADIPLVTSAMLEDFLDTCKSREIDLYFPIVEKAVNERKYPRVKRTYFRLKEGIFTAGNVVLLKPTVLEEHWALIEKAMSLRKSPLKLLQMIGIGFVLRFLFRQLSVTDLERKCEKIFGFCGAAVIVPHPEIGIDVDKESDYKLVLEALT